MFGGEELLGSALQVVGLAVQRGQAGGAELGELSDEVVGVACFQGEGEPVGERVQRGGVVIGVGVLDAGVVVQPHVVVSAFTCVHSAPASLTRPARIRISARRHRPSG